MNQLMELKWKAGEGQILSVQYQAEGVVQPGTDGDYIPTTGKIPKFKRIDKLKEEVDQQLALIQSQWIRSYYQSFLKVWIKEMFQSTGYPKTGTAVYLAGP